jgi:hypothetical protein
LFLAYFINSLLFYDLAIHNIAIGFIGLSITLYLPLMLPPITGKVIRFTSLSTIPLVFIIISLSVRAIADFSTAQPFYAYSLTLAMYEHTSSVRMLTYLFGLSGWLVVVAMLVFVIMIHKSMNEVAVMPGGSNARRCKKGTMICNIKTVKYEYMR